MKLLLAAIILTISATLFAGTPEQDTAKLPGRWKGTLEWTSRLEQWTSSQDHHAGPAIEHSDKVDFIVEAGAKRVKVLRAPLLGSNEGSSYATKLMPDGSITWSYKSLGDCYLPVDCRLSVAGDKAEFEFRATVLYNWIKGIRFGFDSWKGKTTLIKDD